MVARAAAAAPAEPAARAPVAVAALTVTRALEVLQSGPPPPPTKTAGSTARAAAGPPVRIAPHSAERAEAVHARPSAALPRRERPLTTACRLRLQARVATPLQYAWQANMFGKGECTPVELCWFVRHTWVAIPWMRSW